MSLIWISKTEYTLCNRLILGNLFLYEVISPAIDSITIDNTQIVNQKFYYSNMPTLYNYNEIC